MLRNKVLHYNWYFIPFYRFTNDCPCGPLVFLCQSCWYVFERLYSNCNAHALASAHLATALLRSFLTPTDHTLPHPLMAMVFQSTFRKEVGSIDRRHCMHRSFNHRQRKSNDHQPRHVCIIYQSPTSTTQDLLDRRTTSEGGPLRVGGWVSSSYLLRLVISMEHCSFLVFLFHPISFCNQQQ